MGANYTIAILDCHHKNFIHLLQVFSTDIANSYLSDVVNISMNFARMLLGFVKLCNNNPINIPTLTPIY